MKYLFDNVNELPNSMKKWISENKKTIDILIKKRNKKKLVEMEVTLLQQWFFLKLRIDTVSFQTQHNTREQLLEARFEMTRLNEILIYLRDNSPFTTLKKQEALI